MAVAEKLLARYFKALLIMGSKLSLRRLVSLSPPTTTQPHEGAKFTNNSTTYDPEPSSHSSGMFSGSQNFTVTAQTLTNVTTQYPASAPSDFRMIPLGDIDLRHEIRVDNLTGIVDYHRGPVCFRRMHSARVEGRKAKVTVAMYHGTGAEEVCGADPPIMWSQLNSLRRNGGRKLRNICLFGKFNGHPNIIQIYGAASSGGINAILFHDDLVPFKHFLDLYQSSHFATVYLFAYCSSVEFTMWIRPSTGRLCAELTPPSGPDFWFSPLHEVSGLQNCYVLNAPDTEAIVTDSLTLQMYHEICHKNLSQ
ncbi:hypothetical protein DFH08DRAFT_820380 [Mycena albidolilacea]|uniref:Uncharacterized protein n=1 Tax=Mycena albidolilacea TaxID=1033008 RepID=A0AAD6ZCG7_9AGAR|nr:hypothetical protein DFH08DRAFT_820380 [Mycena albidolilacea]